jgi:hypothetical protein
MLTKNAVIQKMSLLIPKRVASQLLNKFKEGSRGSGVESGNILLQFCTFYSKVDRAWGFEVF